MLLQALSEAGGVSGNEGQVRGLLLEAVSPKADLCRVDTMGNLICFKKGKGRARRKVMVAAHMDEVGLMVTGIEESGLLRFAPVGGIDPRVLPGTRVRIGEGNAPGVIGIRPLELTEPGEREKVTPAKQLFIDIGAGSSAAAQMLVRRGDYAAFDVQFVGEQAGSGLRTVQGKSFDDRAGCAALAELFEGRYPVDLYGVFTVQEEVGLRGARVAAFAIDPDWAFVLECTGANEIPTKRDVGPSTRLGLGPAVTVMDKSFIADPGLMRLLLDSAERRSIPHQVQRPLVGGTDAGAIHLAREGVPSATLSIPCRFLHAPKGLLSLNDFENAVLLIKEVLQSLPERRTR